MTIDFATLPRYARIGGAAALAASLLLVLRLSFPGPRMRELDGKRAALAGRQAELAEARREREALARARNRVDDLTRRLDRLGAAPSGREEASVLARRLRDVAVRSNLTVRALRPRPAVQGDLHTEWSFRLRLDGTYRGLARFFAEVGGLSPIVTIDDVVVRAVDSPSSDRTIAAECTATTFVPLDPSAPGGGGTAEASRMSAARAGAVLSAVLTGLGGAAALAAAGEQPPSVPAREPLPPPGIAIGREADGGRDPFVRPAAPDVRGQAAGRPVGRAGLAVDEAVLRGVVAIPGDRLAVLEAPDGRSYVVRRGDRLHDGRVQEIAGDAVALRPDAAGSAPFAERAIRKRLGDTGSGR